MIHENLANDRSGPRDLTATAVALVLGLAACHRADSLLLVEVAGDNNLQARSLAVTVTIHDRQKPTFQIPKDPSAAITFPASFSVEVDRSETGPVTIALSAFDDGGNMIAAGETTQQHINVGGETVIAVNIAAPGTAPPSMPVDGGTP